MNLKKRQLLIVGVMGLLAVILYRFMPSRTYVNLPPSASGDWVAFGDSLTSGFGATEGNDYPSVLSRRLGIPIRNYGVTGETTRDALRRVEQIASLNPQVVLLCFGGNDSLRSYPPEETYQNLSQIIDELHAAGSFVVLIGVRSASVFDKNESLFKRLAKEKRVFLVGNILKDVAGHSSRMSDYIHPNDAGYAFIAERLEYMLRPLLPELRH